VRAILKARVQGQSKGVRAGSGSMSEVKTQRSGSGVRSQESGQESLVGAGLLSRIGVRSQRSGPYPGPRCRIGFKERGMDLESKARPIRKAIV
jgi:hypothetical protein